MSYSQSHSEISIKMVLTVGATSEIPDVVYWFILLVAVIGVSSAGSMFIEVDDVPPVLRASFRLQCTSLVLVGPAIVQWNLADAELRATFFSKKSITLLFTSGLFVGAHFACWVASLDLTTLTHSLLFVTSHPLVIVVGMVIGHRLHDPVVVPLYQTYLQKKRKRTRSEDPVSSNEMINLGITSGESEEIEESGMSDENHECDGNEGCLNEAPLAIESVRDPSRLEILGAILGFAGAGLTLLDEGTTQGPRTVSAEGDGLAFIAAVFFVLYMVCGRVLRRAGMPLFVYAFPVTFIGSLVLLPFSALLEPKGFSALGPVGWHLSGHYLLWFFALSFVAGLAGHTGFNFVLIRLSPLVISTAATTEPVIGTLIGYLLFGNDFPPLWTFLGGGVLLLGLLLVVYGSETCEDSPLLSGGERIMKEEE